jgi:methionyl-tRNA formyltransferase
MDVVEWPAVENSLDTPGIGLTLHFMDRGLDTGPIIMKKQIQLNKHDTFRSIRERIEYQMADTVMEGLQSLYDNVVNLQYQKLEEGKQYFVMHRRLHDYAEKKLKEYLDTLAERKTQ